MATTRMTATNSFQKGLVMDFNPAVTKDDVLTNALNATILTFNGNEGQLQQDMGNGRVETAFLPEGYIPVGTCEFGDIIYIVSYNPLENKSQIGCFPSPERNITSDEITEMQQNLTANDFQEFTGTTPTGKLKATSVKKIVYGNKNMNPGDKFIIYEETTGDNSVLKTNKATLSDYGNSSHRMGTWPKLVKLKIVSIEDSGRIIDLGASVKWYDNDYYLAAMKANSTSGKPDIDSYRSLVSSAYSVFQSKVSGKLAILAELEAVEGFSCTYDVYTWVDEENHETHYKIYFYTSWDTDHNDVNPTGFIITKSEWTKDQDGGKLIYWKEKSAGSYEETVATEQSPLPVEAGATSNGYDYSKVIEYTRLYDLAGSESLTYQKYINEESYNAKIGPIVAWDTSKVSLAANKLSNLRAVTKVTRLLNIQETNAVGEPILDDGKFQYVYNLDDYKIGTTEDPETGKKTKTATYYTKGNDGTMVALKPVSLTDDVINNYFGKDIPKKIHSDDYVLKTQTECKSADGTATEILDNKLDNLIWNYAVAPVMPYGVLDYLETSGTIDFSKLGKGLIDLTAWRYYVAGNVATLTWGLDAYVEQNKGIAEVVMDFFDNQGKAASYHITGKTSFAGMFTESIVLGQKNSSYKLDSTDAYGNTYKHAGGLAEEDDTDIVYLTKENKVTETKPTGVASHAAEGPYKNDAGTLYPNLLYLVRITVKYCPKDLMGEFLTEDTSNYKTFYRWMWTNGIFNEHYYNLKDFNNLRPGLSLDFSATFSTKGDGGTKAMTASQVLYRDGIVHSYSELENQLYKTIGANVYAINQDKAADTDGNVLLTLSPGLAEGFNTFNLAADKLNLISGIKVQLGNSVIKKSIEEPSYIHTGSEFTHLIDPNIQPLIAQYLDSHDSGGWDRSGYIGYNYGGNKSKVSDTLLGLLNVTRSTYTKTTQVEESEAGAVTNQDGANIYESAEAYEAYLDAFSLNMVGGSLTKNADNPLTYVDSDGVTQTLAHWTEKTVDMATAANTGIKLVLTGITFSKMFASEAVKDPSAKVLNSIMANPDPTIEGSVAYNCPEAYGLHYNGGHMYFSRVLAWEMGESGGKSTRWGADYYDVTSSQTNWGGNRYDNRTKSHNEWNPEFTNSEIQERMRGAMTKPFVAFIWGKNGGGNGKINKVYSDVSWNSIHKAFGTNMSRKNPYDSSGDCPDTSQINSTGSYALHTFAVYDQGQNIVIPFADYFISRRGSQVKFSDSYFPVTRTLADMIGSLLIQLYVMDTSGDADSSLLQNFVSLQEYVETWNKDIIVQVDPSTGGLANQSNINQLITIQTQPSQTYFDCVKNNSGLFTTDAEWASVSKDNISLTLYGTQRVITFQFGVPYNLGNLLYLYEQLSTSRNMINLAVLDSDSATPESKTFTGNVTANTLYTWTGDNVVPFGAGSSLVYAKEFKYVGTGENQKLYMVKSGNRIKSSAFATLAKVMRYDGGDITWDNVSQFSSYNATYRVRYDGTGDDPGIRNLPMVSIFNEYKPGT